MTAPWDAGRARAFAGRDLPSEDALLREWGYSTLEAGLFSLGYVEATCGDYPPGTRETIERAYELADNSDEP